jgi:hypothetical protein
MADISRDDDLGQAGSRGAEKKRLLYDPKTDRLVDPSALPRSSQTFSQTKKPHKPKNDESSWRRGDVQRGNDTTSSQVVKVRDDTTDEGEEVDEVSSNKRSKVPRVKNDTAKDPESLARKAARTKEKTERGPRTKGLLFEWVVVDGQTDDEDKRTDGEVIRVIRQVLRADERQARKASRNPTKLRSQNPNHGFSTGTSKNITSLENEYSQENTEVNMVLSPQTKVVEEKPTPISNPSTIRAWQTRTSTLARIGVESETDTNIEPDGNDNDQSDNRNSRQKKSKMNLKTKVKFDNTKSKRKERPAVKELDRDNEANQIEFEEAQMMEAENVSNKGSIFDVHPLHDLHLSALTPPPVSRDNRNTFDDTGSADDLDITSMALAREVAQGQRDPQSFSTFIPGVGLSPSDRDQPFDRSEMRR